MEPVEKTTIKINFEGSGVKTLTGLGDMFLALALFCLLGCVITLLSYMTAYSSQEALYLTLITTFLTSFIGLLTAYAICIGLSSIARTALYQRMIIEQKYDINIEKSK